MEECVKNVAYCSKNTFDSSMQYATISFPSLKRGGLDRPNFYKNKSKNQTN